MIFCQSKNRRVIGRHRAMLTEKSKNRHPNVGGAAISGIKKPPSHRLVSLQCLVESKNRQQGWASLAVM